jgi:hypothetical protein
MRTRQSSALLKRLKKDQYPILFEGMHTAGLIWHPSLKSRQKLIRMHNVEWQYYESLSQLTPATAPLEKAYYFSESIKLQRIEPKVVLHADEIITISGTDEAYYRALKANTHYVPAFHPNDAVESMSGKGDYVLFHGKLSVPDNELAAKWIIQEVFADFDIPLVIAGMAPSDRLKELVSQYEHIRLVENPDEAQMNSLLSKAHINLLISFQSSGVKLKLINALFRGRFCIVNDQMVRGTGLAKLCYVKNSAAAVRQTIEALINAPFEPGKISERKAVLEAEFSNVENANKLIQLIKW